jgi:hypothetical protein
VITLAALLVVAASLIGIGPVAAATCTPDVGPGIPAPASPPAGIPGFHASWYGQSGYQSLCPGQTSTAVVAYYNSGSLGWVRGVMGQVAYLGTWQPEPGQDLPSVLGGDGQLGSPNTAWPRYNRVAAQPAAYVGPGQVAWFQFTLKAPQTPGTYRLAIRPLVEGATWMEDYGVFWVLTVKNADGTPPPTPTPTPIATPPPPSSGFTCTQLIGYSQTDNWYDGLESVVANDRYELLWNGGGAVRLWADPGYAGWSQPLYSPCASGSGSPDRIVMDITEDFFIKDPANGGVTRVASDIRGVIQTIRNTYPAVRQIYLQPVVGGPNGGLCSVAGSEVRASSNHPYIKSAIAQVVGGTVLTGPSPTVRTCADYADDIGHLQEAAKIPIGQGIGSFYASRP